MPPFLLFLVNIASEYNVIPAIMKGDNLQSSHINFNVYNLRSKSTRYYPNHVIYEKWSFALMLLSFAFLLRPTAAKDTRLIMHSSKRMSG